jgi:hypothetical protein
MTIIKYTKDDPKTKQFAFHHIVEFKPCCKFMDNLYNFNDYTVEIAEKDKQLQLMKIYKPTNHIVLMKFCTECGTKIKFEEITDKLGYIKQKMQPHSPIEYYNEELDEWVKESEDLRAYTERTLLEILQNRVKKYPKFNNSVFDETLDDYMKALDYVFSNIKKYMGILQ